MADTDGTPSGVARRYASALFDLAKEADTIEAVTADMATVQTMLDESADFRRLVRSPVYSTEEQVKALSAVFEKAGIGGLVANFFKLVARNRRLFAAPAMLAAYRSLEAAHRGEVVADVTSAEPLTDAQLERLEEALAETGGRHVRLVTKVDPALIGGLVVKLGSRMIDTSLRTKLNGLGAAMKRVG